MSNPLSHITVLDLSRVLAGPWASQILADLGANVIKIERPGAGDDTRAWGPPFLQNEQGEDTRESGYYLIANRGKKSISVDIKTAEGQEIIKTIAKQADVVLENFKVGTLEKLGLGYEDLQRINPRLIYCSITGFGQSGPRKSQPAYDFMIQAMGGIMSVTGEADHKPGGGPQKIGIPLIDLITGVYASSAILSALVHRNETGRGEYIDMAMLDVQVSLLANQAMNYLLTDQIPIRRGNNHPNIQPQRVYTCKNGQIILAVGSDAQFAKLCLILGCPDMAESEKFKTNAARVVNLAELDNFLDQALAKQDKATLLSALEQAGVPSGPINNIAEVFDDPQVKHRGLLKKFPHPLREDIPQVVNPFRFRHSALKLDLPPPLLGQHNTEILSALGYSDSDISRLKEHSII
ncbi:CoA transferase [Advenella kashmirensis W13003]|uniref:CoA transferase n=1 Tax=Advenella kashmirensis W13003 TaxID=1424334 RepID=V8QWM9_9BURK|nr:CaiB/BaiF CoA-transferase family protein [Advenella kashmirensis]ETF03419.1 CoA transferase [Advenella kashmirensis W13003]